MAFAGDLHTFDLFDLLGWLVGRKKAGVLQVTRRSTKKRLTFRDAAVQWSSSNDPRETIGQALVRDGLITEEALFRALLKQETDKRRLGELLIADGHLTEPQLMKSLRSNAEAQFYDLFLWSDGRFEFDDERPPAPDPSDLKIDLKPLLDEGRYRRELWQKLRTRFPSSEVTFQLIADPVTVTNPALRQVVDLAAWGKTLAGISLETRRSEYETTLLVAGLCDRGVLAVDRVEAGAPEADPVGIITTLLAGAEMRLKEGRFDSALEAYEKVLSLDGVNQAAKKGLLAVAEGRQRAKVAKRIPLERVPVLRLTAVALAQQQFDPQEGFVLSRINGSWDVRSILKLCPMPEEDVLGIFSRLLDRQVIELR
ncbi:MAG TPA: DUF4388 domain-containing protein [Vicinamibacteria bacterium]|nr:DUF4388 domain-containing protein [Vicinamibacteria bacterium]